MDKFRAIARPEGQDTRVLDKDGTVLWEETGSTQMDRPEVCPQHSSVSCLVLVLITVLSLVWFRFAKASSSAC